MQQIYYTQEGLPYVLKSITKNVFSYTPNNGEKPIPLIRVNITLTPPIPPPLPYELDLTTTKKIIPLCLGYAAANVNDFTDGGGEITEGISTFFQIFLGDTTTGSYPGVKAISKLLPLMDRMYFNDKGHFYYNVRYGEAVFCVDDFIDTTNGLFINWGINPGASLSMWQEVIWGEEMNNTMDIRSGLTFTYFELL